MPPKGYYKRPNLLTEDELETAVAKSMRKGMIQRRNEYQAEVDRLDKEIAELETAIQKR